MDRQTLEDVIVRWQSDNLPLVPGKKYGVLYPQLPLGPERQTLVDLLVSNLKDAGMTREEFVNTTQDFIVEYIIPKGQSPDKTRGWRGGTKATLKLSIERIYKSPVKRVKLEIVPVLPTQETTEESIELPKEEPKKPIIKRFDPSKYKDREDKEPPVQDVLNAEMAKLLGIEDDE